MAPPLTRARAGSAMRLMRRYGTLWLGPSLSEDAASPYDYRLLLASQNLFTAGLVLHALFIPLFASLGVVSMAWVNVLSVAAYVLALSLNRRHHPAAALWIAFVEVDAHAVLAVVLVGWDTGFAYYLLATGPMLFLNTQWPLIRRFTVVLLPVLLLAWLRDYGLAYSPAHQIDPAIRKVLYDFNLLATFAVLSFLAYFYSKGARDSERRLRAATRSLEALAATDPLTGLLNRRAMTQEIDHEISRFARQPRAFVLAIGDLDGFKAINDRYGHDAGDSVLSGIARVMTEFLRSHDIVSRWGGEEFVILLPDTDIDGALDTVDRLRERVAGARFAVEGRTLSISITFGLCAYASGMSRDDCLKRADMALYRGKQMGRNQVVVA